MSNDGRGATFTLLQATILLVLKLTAMSLAIAEHL